MNNKEYRCDKCDKTYDKYNSLWQHIKKKHTNIISPLKCQYCEKNYKHASSKSRHEKTCNNKDNNILLEVIKENNELKNTINQLKNDMNKIKNSLVTTKKVVTNNNNNNNNNNTTNNTTNNTLNNINNVYVRYNNISYEDILTKKEIKEILHEKFMALEKSILQIHFNQNKEQYQNVFITKLEGKYGYVYNGGNKLEAKNKDEILDELIDTHLSEIDKYKDILSDKDPKTANKLTELVELIIDDDTPFKYGNILYKNYSEFKKENLNTIIFNNTDKDKFNKTNKIKLIEKEII